MIKEYLIFDDRRNKIKILADKDILDYYTNIIFEISIGKKKIELLRDNIVYFFNQIKPYVSNPEEFKLDDALNENELGLLLNEYYYCINKDIINSKIVFDNQGRWIGEKYCCFLSSRYATWLYWHNNNINIKISPMFEFFDEDNNYEQYKKFKEEYSDIFNTQISNSQLNNMFEIISSLYESIIKC